MITELSKQDFHKIVPLLEDERTNLEIKAVIGGYNPGWVFVDRQDRPQTAMVWSKGIEGFYFIGSTETSGFLSSINSFIDEIIAPRAKALGLTHFEFSATNDGWDKIIPGLFNARDLTVSKQLVFTKELDSEALYNTTGIPDYQLHFVNRELLSNPSMDTAYLKSAILEWWDSVDVFLENGIGTAVFFENQAICTCVTSFMDLCIMESHIQTKPTHRKKGLAAWAVHAFVENAQMNGYSLYWDCMETNLGSRALAKKMNYRLNFTYPLYEFPFHHSMKNHE